MLGDLCDRGPRSRQAIESAAWLVRSFPGSALVRGNHDDLLLRATASGAGRRDVGIWLARGGGATLESYRPGDPEGALDAISSDILGHRTFLEGSTFSLRDGGLLFAHAGIDPSKGPSEQGDRDLLWARDGFLDHVGSLGAVVVHGHSVVGDLPVVTENRISLDTGAFSSGRLTAAAFDASAAEVRFLQTAGRASRVERVDPVRLDRGYGVATDALYAGRLDLAA